MIFRSLSESEVDLYKEVTFESSEREFLKTLYSVDNQLKKGKLAPVRNWQKLNTERIQNAKLPVHSQFKLTTKNIFEEYIDPYKYLENPTEKQAKSFDRKENTYTQDL